MENTCQIFCNLFITTSGLEVTVMYVDYIIGHNIINCSCYVNLN